MLACEDGPMLTCPECGHEWTGAAPAGARVIRDFVGNPLTDGDTVTVIRDLKVKGSSPVVNAPPGSAASASPTATTISTARSMASA